MQTVNTLFYNRQEAEKAFRALVKYGVNEHDISLIANGESNVVEQELSGHNNGKGTAIGAAAGVGVGTLAGLAALAIPGFGEIAITGWLAAMLGGALAGGALGAAVGNMTEIMRKAGVNEHEAHFFADAVQQGGVLLIARVPDSDANHVRAILADFEAIKPQTSTTRAFAKRTIVDDKKSPYVQAHEQAKEEKTYVNHNIY